MVFEFKTKSIQNTTMDEQHVLFLKNEVKTLKERLDNLTETVEKGK